MKFCQNSFEAFGFYFFLVCQYVQTLSKRLPQISNFAIFSPSKIQCLLR